MKRFTLILSVAFAATGANAHPVGSPALFDAMKRQMERAQQGLKGTEAFQNDLRPIANAGDPVAKFYLGNLVVNSDKASAKVLLRESAMAGCAGAAGALALLQSNDDVGESKKWRQIAVEGGDATAIVLTSGAYKSGAFGEEKDAAAALAWADLAWRQTYSTGVRAALTSEIAVMKAGLSPSELSRASTIEAALFSAHPKVSPYPCGQATP